MKWLEVIRVRSAGNDFELLKESLRSFEKSGEPALIGMKTYYHAALASDLSIHVYWESGEPEQNGSALGLRLAHALKEFGLTDHSVWIEKENENPLKKGEKK